jgi:hypothetical protein
MSGAHWLDRVRPPRCRRSWSSKGLEHAPKLAREIADRGHECAVHGITRAVGYNPQDVWRSANTLSLL